MSDDEPVQIINNTTKKMLKNTGKRSTKQSKQLLNSYLTMLGNLIAKESKDLAEHAGRKTIQEKDVRKAIKNNDKLDLA